MHNDAGSGGRGGSYPTMLSCVQAAVEKETQKPWFWEQVKEHRCVPNIGFPADILMEISIFLLFSSEVSLCT